MSILIKGMRMPESCGKCPFLIEEDIDFDISHQCEVGKVGYIYKADLDSFPADCPLVDLGKHGRLIDADDLKNHICAWAINGRPLYRICKYDDLLELLNAIDNVPTVIEAEDKE